MVLGSKIFGIASHRDTSHLLKKMGSIHPAVWEIRRSEVGVDFVGV
jgi:hypothetical protein